MTDKINLYKSACLSNHIEIDGDGNKYLANNGKYKQVDTNTYTVDTIEEMNNLKNVKEGYICVVNKDISKKLIEVGDNLKGKTIYFTGIENSRLRSDNILQATNTTNSNIFCIKYNAKYVYPFEWYIQLEDANKDIQYIQNNSSELLINNYIVQDDYIVDFVLDSDEFYLGMYTKEEKQSIYRYENNTWIKIEIEQSNINGNIKKGNKEIIVYRPNRKNTKEHITDNDNHTITIGLDDYDVPIHIETYKDSNNNIQLYTIIFEDNVSNNISSTYNFECYYNEENLEGFQEYDYLNLPIESGGSNYSIKVNPPSVSKKFYINLNHECFTNISCEKYMDIPKGLKKVNIKASYNSYHYGTISSNYNNNNIISVSGNYSTSYKNILISYFDTNDGIKIFTDNNSSINDLNWSSNLQKSSLCILYICDNELELDTYLKSRLDFLGCSKYKTVTNLKSYLLISYKGIVFEYVNDEDNIDENLSFIIDEDGESIMLIGNQSQFDTNDLNNKISNINNMSDNNSLLNKTVNKNKQDIVDINDMNDDTTMLNTTINENSSNIEDLQKTGVLWMGKFSEGNKAINFNALTRTDVDKITDLGGSISVSDNIVTFKAPLKGVYCFRGRCNFASTTTSGSLIINIGSGYLLKETKISTNGGDTRQFYQNIPMVKNQTINISFDESSDIDISNIFLEISRY